MTHMTPGGGLPVASRTPAATKFQPSATARVLSLDYRRLCEAIAVRRQRLAEREADLVAACEKAVAHGAARHIRVDDRATWDRAAWNRYVGTAMRLEPQFMPEILRLVGEIELLERLVALSATRRPAAA